MKKIILFVLLSTLMFSKYRAEKNKVYYNNILIKKVNVRSFEILSDYYARDKNTVYYQGDILENSDVKTFKILDEFYAKDK